MPYALICSYFNTGRLHQIMDQYLGSMPLVGDWKMKKFNMVGVMNMKAQV